MTLTIKPYPKRRKMPKVGHKAKKRSKPKPKSITVLKKHLWELCKQIIRKRDGDSCFICGKSGLTGGGWHTGHFLPSSSCGAWLRFDLRNLHSSCYYCNINLGGNGAMYYQRLVKSYGQEFVDALFEDKEILFVAKREFYEQRIKDYAEISGWDKDKLLDHTRILTKEGRPPSSVVSV